MSTVEIATKTAEALESPDSIPTRLEAATVIRDLLVELNGAKAAVATVSAVAMAGIPRYRVGAWVRLTDEVLGKALIPKDVTAPLGLLVLSARVVYEPHQTAPSIEYLVQTMTNEPGARQWVLEECVQEWAEEDRSRGHSEIAQRQSELLGLLHHAGETANTRNRFEL